MPRMPMFRHRRRHGPTRRRSRRAAQDRASADLAARLGLPVLLAIDAPGNQSAAALVRLRFARS
jgi:hypothetical protein